MKQQTINLEALLDYISGNVYDTHHGMLPEIEWVVNALDLLDYLRQSLDMSEAEMTVAFDNARVRVHGQEEVTRVDKEEGNEVD
jgi:uncharacterized protein Smg (DUF494 family)